MSQPVILIPPQVNLHFGNSFHCYRNAFILRLQNCCARVFCENYWRRTTPSMFQMSHFPYDKPHKQRRPLKVLFTGSRLASRVHLNSEPYHQGLKCENSVLCWGRLKGAAFLQRFSECLDASFRLQSRPSVNVSERCSERDGKAYQQTVILSLQGKNLIVVEDILDNRFTADLPAKLLQAAHPSR